MLQEHKSAENDCSTMAPRRGSQYQGAKSPTKAIAPGTESSSFSLETLSTGDRSLKKIEDSDHNDLSLSGRSGSRSSNNNENSTTNQDFNGSSSRDLQGEDLHEQSKVNIADRVAHDETQALRRLKQFSYRIVILVAVGLGLTAFFKTQADEASAFQSGFHQYAQLIAVGMNLNVQRAVDALEGLALSTSSLTSHMNSTVWPFVTVPEFERSASYARFLASTPLVVLSPQVNETNRTAWQAYATMNQGWTRSDEQIPFFLHNDTSSDAPLPVNSPGPFAPVWEMSPPPRNDVSIVNYDIYGNPVFRPLYKQVMDNVVPAWSDFCNTTSLFGSSAPDTGGSPQSILLQPIVSSSAPRVPAVLTTVFDWIVYLQGIAPPEVNGLVVVLVDSYGRAGTFQVDGLNATFLGTGDLYNPKYAGMVYTAPLACSQSSLSGTTTVLPRILQTENGSVTPSSGEEHQPTSCPYTLYIYPSDELEAIYASGDLPAVYVTVVVMIVVGTSLAFLLFDKYTKRKDELLMAKAERAHAIVASLFPETVQDRLMAGKAGLKSYLQDGDDYRADAFDPETKPIADLWPNTTISFCDCVGFTAWSSTREPAQIFLLLETLFSAFDEIARKHGVFKVESVGDCYVAVCGLPDPREDHAVVMARYARDCQRRVRELLHQLEVTLGPDTSELSIRFGLHSGPVIAGVLRGERARFQLFGDTMNTASRIETSSVGGKIHVSQECAELLMQAGKSKWLKKRQDVVHAKGKGAIETYWLVSASNKAHAIAEKSIRPAQTATSVASSETDDRTFASESYLENEADLIPDQSTNQKKQRLVDWNCELLLTMLQKIVARRRVKNKRRSAPNTNQNEHIRRCEAAITKHHNLLGELVEVIKLPEYDAQSAKAELDFEKVDLGENVASELRAFISLLASMYRDENPFHNWEHASHVTMSVYKLLARIVAAESILDKHKDSVESPSDIAGLVHEYTYGIASDPLAQFAVVLSALIHDVDHRGVPNFILEKEDPQLAAAYKHKSTAEQNSIDLAWNALMDPGFENLRKCIYSTEAELDRFRKILVNSVMATDIFDKELGQLRKNRWAKAFPDLPLPEAPSEMTTVEALNRKATIVIEHVIQASDVSHCMQHWYIYIKWNERLFEEMYTAYVEKRSDKDPSAGWYNGEIWFFDNYIIPLAKKLKDCGVFGVSSDEYLNYATRNRQEWERKGHEIVEKMVARVKGRLGVGS